MGASFLLNSISLVFSTFESTKLALKSSVIAIQLDGVEISLSEFKLGESSLVAHFEARLGRYIELCFAPSDRDLVRDLIFMIPCVEKSLR